MTDIIEGAHHVGITVADMERSSAFWGALLGAEPTATEHLAGPGLGRLVGYPSVRMERRWVEAPGGPVVELLRYLDRDEAPYDPGTAHPGNVHVCLAVSDVPAAHAHALACGATGVGDGWIEVPAGPNAGARIAYVRGPDGVTVELFEKPKPRAQW
ncbi:MAG TPA: VOC family protein [Acidimicrobiales bacterium]|nr:VOC family protein [Acidimicrobiales bacterium]